jgi:RNA polymerase sigma factor (sigma-70 family)
MPEESIAEPASFETRRAPGRTARAAHPAEAVRGRYFSFARRHLRTLYRFARHELDYRTSTGDLVEGELSPEDVVDAVLLEGYREFVRTPARRRSAGWLLRLTGRHLESEVSRLQALRAGTVSIEEDVPETPPREEVTTLGEELLFFYQPDEDLKLEDLLPDLGASTPEEVAETREIARCVRATLEEMPADWRRALLLRHAEGLQPTELAEALGQPKAEIERILEQALERLRRRLEEAGYGPHPLL